MGNVYRCRVFPLILYYCVLNCFSLAQDDSRFKDDRECDLNSASKCFSQNIFQCYLNPSAPAKCSSPQSTNADGLLFEEMCSSINYTINGCLMDMLGYGCNGTDRHGFYEQWRKPLNAVLNKLCSGNQSILKTLVGPLESECSQGSFMNCLRQTENTVDLIDLVSTEMTAETCSDLDLRLQLCLQFDHSQCKTLLNITMDLVKEFVDNAACKNQPIILVPLDDDNPNSERSEDDRDCEPRLASECFDPMLAKWDCYFQERKCASNFTEICSFTEYALHTCGMGILGYGCDNTPKHHYYKNWLEPLTTVHKKMCRDSKDFNNVKGCWVDFLSCFRKSDIAGNPANLITSEITTSVCWQAADIVDSCVSQLNFPQCDNMMDTVEDMKITFLMSQPCANKESITSSVRRKSEILHGKLIIFICILYYIAQSQ